MSGIKRVCDYCGEKMHNFGFHIEGKMCCNRCMQDKFRVNFKKFNENLDVPERNNGDKITD